MVFPRFSFLFTYPPPGDGPTNSDRLDQQIRVTHADPGYYSLAEAPRIELTDDERHYLTGGDGTGSRAALRLGLIAGGHGPARAAPHYYIRVSMGFGRGRTTILHQYNPVFVRIVPVRGSPMCGPQRPADSRKGPHR